VGEARVFKSKYEQVYDHMQALILDGRLEPGSRLVIDHLAAQLGVSQNPIREALFRLEAAGFVTHEAHIGAHVTELHANQVREVFRVLEAMEIITSQAACDRLSEDDLVWLERHIAAMAGSTHDAEAWSAGNKQLHRYIGERSDSALAARVLETALDHWDRLRRHFLDEVFSRRIPVAQKEHLALFAALKRRDPAEVERALREHNQAALAAYAEHLKAQGHLDGAPS
jgi:DNA-binding GntR family transcriptional regulator